MWTRAELKEKAKTALRPFYWYGVLACLIAAILGAGSSGIGSGGGSAGASSQARGNSNYGGTIFDEHAIALFITLMIVFLIVLAVAIVLGIFVSNIVIVGKLRFFMESASQGQSAGIGRLFFAFGGGHYLNVMKIMFFKGLFETLWTFFIRNSENLQTL